MKTTNLLPDTLKREQRTLRLWMPGYHTPSLNVTSGKHWSLVRKLKQVAAGNLLAALQGDYRTGRPSDGETVREGKRVLGRIALGLPVEMRKGKKPAKPAVPARLRIERVTVSVMDEENFKGSTKGLVDCLRYAFPTVLLDDAPGYVVMEWVQTKCGSKCEQGTWVELSAGATEISQRNGEQGND